MFYDYDLEECYMTFIEQLSMGVGIVTIGTFFSFFIISFAFYKNKKSYKSESEDETETESETEEETEQEKYLNLYPLSEASNTYTNKVEISNSIVVETTPNGNVLMMYDFDNQTFIYWSYESNIDYKYLETVARKYVTMFNCKELYIEHTKFVSKEELDKNKQTETEEGESEQTENVTLEKQEGSEDIEDVKKSESGEEPLEEKPKSVFANLKSYKKKVDTEADVEVNHFLRKGSIRDFTHSLVEKLEVKAKDVDYKSFSQKLMEGFSS